MYGMYVILKYAQQPGLRQRPGKQKHIVKDRVHSPVQNPPQRYSKINSGSLKEVFQKHFSSFKGPTSCY